MSIVWNNSKYVPHRQAPVAAPGSFGYTEEKAQTYLGETFWKSVPSPESGSAVWETDMGHDTAAPIQLLSMNHAALGVQDVESMIKYGVVSALIQPLHSSAYASSPVIACPVPMRL
jgi:hypothetical protein